MKNLYLCLLIGSVVFLGGCTVSFNNEEPAAVASTTPVITAVTFDGNGVVIQGERLTGALVAFTVPGTGMLCRELITPNCVLQKAVSTDNTIKFISNWIGGNGIYEVYVENETKGESNKMSMVVKK